VGSHQWKWVLGDGSCIRFWEDNWVDGNSLKNMFPQLFSLLINRGGFVSEFTKISPHEEKSFGEIKFRRRLYSCEVVQEKEFLKTLDQFKVNSTKRDKFNWLGGEIAITP
jgi:hypothetical protein